MQRKKTGGPPLTECGPEARLGPFNSINQKRA